MSQADYLNAMGISTWVVAEGESAPEVVSSEVTPQESINTSNSAPVWTFIIDQLSGDASVLFDKM